MSSWPSSTPTTSCLPTPTSACSARSSADRLGLRHGQRAPPLGAGARRQARFLARTFAQTRLATHVTRVPPRCSPTASAWNKLFRRSFWDEHGLPLPRGSRARGHPGDPPAAFPRTLGRRASPTPSTSIAMRDDGDLSITQRRLEQRVLLDRLAAIEEVDAFLTDRGFDEPRHWYEESVFADDLRYHLNVLDDADPAYRALFLEHVNGLLARARPGRSTRSPRPIAGSGSSSRPARSTSSCSACAWSGAGSCACALRGGSPCATGVASAGHCDSPAPHRMSPVPQISVVVPIFNVERYLAACLESAAAQTVSDLEIVMVDDGSTDGSAAIAERVRRRATSASSCSRSPNGGLSEARNTGIDAATGRVPRVPRLRRRAAARRLRAAARGRSRRPARTSPRGNVHRLTAGGHVAVARSCAKAFARTQLKTHVTRFRPLLADRIAWNKLWRRSFWDEHRFRFPEGVRPRGHPGRRCPRTSWRARSTSSPTRSTCTGSARDGELSITQRRLEPRVLLDRLAAVEQVADYLAEHGPRRARAGTRRASSPTTCATTSTSSIGRRPRVPRALPRPRQRVPRPRIGRAVYDDLTAIDRLKWHLVRRRMMPEMLEVLRFRARGSADTRRRCAIARRWYGDYPFRTDRELRSRRPVYRLDSELHAARDDRRPALRERAASRSRGFAFIHGDRCAASATRSSVTMHLARARAACGAAARCGSRRCASRRAPSTVPT